MVSSTYLKFLLNVKGIFSITFFPPISGHYFCVWVGGCVWFFPPNGLNVQELGCSSPFSRQFVENTDAFSAVLCRSDGLPACSPPNPEKAGKNISGTFDLGQELPVPGSLLFLSTLPWTLVCHSVGE